MRTCTCVSTTFVVLLATMWGQSAQNTHNTAVQLSDTDIQLLRSDLRADIDKVIADTMDFSQSESSAFWPVYRNYAREQQLIGDDLAKLVRDFDNHYDKMDDMNANAMVQRLLNLEDRALNLRKEYWPKFERALGARRAAKFYQVENELGLMMRLQLVSKIPLLP